MNEHIAVFVSAPYLLNVGSAILKQTNSNAPASFNIFGFKDAVQTHVKRLVPNARILRIYWYEGQIDDEVDELNRLKTMAKNGIKLRTLDGDILESDLSSQISHEMVLDIEKLVNNQAISDVLIIDQHVSHLDAILDFQSRGIHIHLVDLGEKSEDDTLDIRTEIDTYSTWSGNVLAGFFLNEFKTVDQERLLLKDALAESTTFESYVSDESAVQDEVEVAKSDRVLREDYSDVGDMQQFESRAVREIPDNFEHEDSSLEDVIYSYVHSMSTEQIKLCLSRWQSGVREVPVLHDRNVLALCRRGLDRNLTPEERVSMRAIFHEAVSGRSQDGNLENTTLESIDYSEIPVGASSNSNESPIPHMKAPQARGFPLRQSIHTGEIDLDDSESAADITEFVELYIAGLSDDDLRSCINFWDSGQIGVPYEFDKGTMSLCRQELGRPLDEPEKFFMRRIFREVSQEVAQDRNLD